MKSDNVKKVEVKGKETRLMRKFCTQNVRRDTMGLRGSIQSHTGK
jgi:hypothetical protein